MLALADGDGRVDVWSIPSPESPSSNKRLIKHSSEATEADEEVTGADDEDEVVPSTLLDDEAEDALSQEITDDAPVADAEHMDDDADGVDVDAALGDDVGADDAAADEEDEEEDDEAEEAHTAVQLSKLQEPFMPSSSPIGESRRYMCWNAVGTITRRTEGFDTATVEIEFADKGRHHAVCFDNI